VSADPGTSPGTAAAGALAQRSRRRIADVLVQHPAGVGVEEIAGRVGLQPNAVRRHLGTLVAAGIVVTERAEARGRGRPRLRYRLVDMQAPLVAAHQELVRVLLEYIVHTDADAGDLEAFGRAQGGFLAVGAGADAVAESFARLGFAPRETGSADDRARGRLTLHLENCPFRDAVAAPGGTLVCRLHRGLTEGMVAATVPGGRLAGFQPKEPVRAGCRVTLEGLRTTTG
jgi:predicted ArsR family transcriptional regulator